MAQALACESRVAQALACEFRMAQALACESRSAKPEGRRIIAHGASRGKWCVRHAEPRNGAKDSSQIQTTSESQPVPSGPPEASLAPALRLLTSVSCLLTSLFLACLIPLLHAQSPPPPRKKLLAIGEEKGYRHEAVTHALATIERLGRQTGLWDTYIRTDTEPLTKKKLEYNAKNLNDFDAVLFYTGGTLEMDDQQKADFLSFIHDDGKGFIGVHSASITFTQWPAYGEMIGGYYDEHPWGTFEAPILVEDRKFPGMSQWPAAFTIKDEIYQIKNYSRDDRRVLMRLDATKLDLNNPRVHRTDRDFAVAWAKMYGKGRVYYSTLGHVPENWDNPMFQDMFTGAIKWVLGLVDADITPEPAPR